MLKLTERNAPSKGSFYRVAIKKVKLTTVKYLFPWSNPLGKNNTF